MLASQRATKSSLLIEPRWEIDGMIACCSASVVFRLEADYIRCNNYTDGVEDDAKIMSKGFNSRKFRDYICYAPTHLAVPLESAFGAVLSDLVTEKGLIWFASDNMTLRGDVHKGPFSVKNFIAWAIDGGYIESGMVHNRHMEGYTFKILPVAARQAVIRIKNEFRRWYNAEIAKCPIEPNTGPRNDRIVWGEAYPSLQDVSEGRW